MKTFEYRLYPTKAQRRKLMNCLIQSRLIYNEMLEASIKRYRDEGKFLFKYDLNKLFKSRGNGIVPETTVQSLADRLDKALKRFLATKDSGGGFPRLKSGNQWHSIQLRQVGCDFKLDIERNLLQVQKKLGKQIKTKFHRPLEGTPKTCWLVLRADNHWYALIACELPSIERKEPKRIKAIGIDVGLKSFLTDSKGNTVENPRFYRKSQKRLKINQRRMCRRKKGSNRRRKAARSTAKVHLKIGRQRRDFLFKTAKRCTDKFNLIAVEKLNIGGMAKNRNLSKSILDASWGEFVSVLKFKAENAGSKVIEVNPAYTTQECWKCGELVQKSLSVRTHVCPSCGYVADRDVNAAKNILAKGLVLLAREKQAGAQPSVAKPSVGKVRPRSRQPEMV